MAELEQLIAATESYPEALDSVQESLVNRNDLSLVQLKKLEYWDRVPHPDANLIQKLEQRAKLTSVLRQKDLEWKALVMATLVLAVITALAFTNALNPPSIKSKPYSYQTTTYPTYIAREANLIVRPTPSITPFTIPARNPSNINNP